MRKFWSSINMLILQSRIVGAFSSFDAQYNFLRFTDVTEVCKTMEVSTPGNIHLPSSEGILDLASCFWVRS